MIRLVALASAALLYLIVNTVPVQAGGAASILVAVRDVATNQALVLAEVSLIGPEARSSYTDRAGVATFGNLQPGTYHVAAIKSGYSAVTTDVEVTDDTRPMEITIRLSRILAVIGSVSVRRTKEFAPGTTALDAASVLASSSVAKALITDPNLDIMPGGRLSIAGDDPRRTAILINGTPLAPIGIALPLQALDTSLFESASTTRDGPMGGAVDFHLPAPTLRSGQALQARYSAVDGSFGAWSRGTAGRFGYALAVGRNTAADGLDGTIFSDSSGDAVLHRSARRVGGAAGMLRLPISRQNIATVTLYDTTGIADLTCPLQKGIRPCGIGLGNIGRSDLSTFSIRDGLVVGALPISFAVFDTSYRESGSYTAFGAALLGVARDTSSAARTSGYSLDAGLGRTSIAFSAIASAQSGLSNDGSTTTRYGSTSSDWNAIVSRTFGGDGSFAGSASIGVVGASSSMSGNASFAARFTPTVRDTIDIEAATSAGIPVPEIATSFTNPSAFAFDCSRRAAFGAGGGDLSASGRSNRLEMDWTHRSNAWNVRVEATHQVDRDALVGGLLPLSLASAAPGNYLADINAAYASPTLGCGSVDPLPADRVFLNSIFRTTTRKDGIGVQGSVGIARLLIASPFLAYMRAVPVTGFAGSTVAEGSQLPQIPRYRAGVTLDYGRDRPLEVASSVVSVGSNNSFGLPGYTTVDVGVRAALQYGELRISGANVLNQYPGWIRSTTHALPLTLGGTQIVPLASPLQPSTVYVEYRVSIGSHGQAEAAVQPMTIGENSATFVTTPFPRVAPKDPFSVNDDSPACGPENVSTAKAVLGELSSYVEKGSFAPSHRLASGFDVLYRTTPVGYALLLAQGGVSPQTVSAVLDCAVVHMGTDALDYVNAGAYLPEASSTLKVLLIYSPSLGIYMNANAPGLNTVRQPEQTVSYRSSSASVPEDPFATISAPSCGNDIVGPAGVLLADLRTYFRAISTGAAPLQPDQANIEAVSGQRSVYSIRYADPALAELVRRCGSILRVDGGKEAGATWPALNFSTTRGLFVVGIEK